MRDEARHSVAEHKEIDDRLGELIEMNDFASDKWTERFNKLRERYLHHIDEEEEEMFAKADELMSASQEEKLGKTFKKRKPIEKEQAENEMPGDARG